MPHCAGRFSDIQVTPLLPLVWCLFYSVVLIGQVFIQHFGPILLSFFFCPDYINMFSKFLFWSVSGLYSALCPIWFGFYSTLLLVFGLNCCFVWFCVELTLILMSIFILLGLVFNLNSYPGWSNANFLSGPLHCPVLLYLLSSSLMLLLILNCQQL